MHQLAAQIKQQARGLGFDLVGISSAQPSKYREYLRDWLETGQAGRMRWMAGRFEERVAPDVYMPGARSVICVAVNYFAGDSPSVPPLELDERASHPPLPPGEGTGLHAACPLASGEGASYPPLPPGEGRGEGVSPVSGDRPRTHPHPNPLPEGEGSGLPSAYPSSPGEGASHPPLPPGEGRGEGVSPVSGDRPRTHPHPNPLPDGEGTGVHVAHRLAPGEGTSGRVARYAWGADYHELIKLRLHRLADWIRQQAPEAQTRCAVDTAPVMEKELAARAGIGWLGKNTCVINERIGSWVLLGEILTTLELPPDEPAIDRCGTCRRCIDACPTQAITAPYQLDARKCISYLTIEHPDPLEPEDQSKLGEWIFGCDICQEVCPWNGEAAVTGDPAFGPRFADGRLGLPELLNWRQEDYAQRLRGSAMKRVKLPVLKRNAAIVQGNLGIHKEVP